MKNTFCLLSLLAGQLSFAGLSTAAPNYVAHEWGTFTSVQGADGVQLAWNPLAVSDLPGFVYDAAKTAPKLALNQKLLLGKSYALSLQRMETPVIYFYSDEPVTVNARVNFPQGYMTEWYPKANLPRGKGDGSPLEPKTLDWQGIEVFPTRNHGIEAGLGLPPIDPAGSHYFAARETDADLLRVNGEVEKFLFYRGVGNFRAPLTVTQSGDDVEVVSMKNTGREELRHLFLYQVRGDQARFQRVQKLSPDSSIEVKFGEERSFKALSEVRGQLVGEVEKALAGEGLYPREASAMVKTWDDSWFGEQGVRVFYVLSEEWTDRVLPLALEPKPAEVARVMVGRAELITPQMEWDLLREIVRYGSGSAEEKSRAVTAARALGLGRFMEPTVRRLTSRMPSKLFAAHSAELLNAASRTEAAGKRFATR